MRASRSREIDCEDKYEKYKKEILNEKMFSFRVNNLFMNEFEESIEDILILSENQFFIQIRNRVEAELEEIYSEKIFSDKKFLNLIDKGVNYIKSDYNQNYELLNNTYNIYTKNKNFSKNEKITFLTSKYRRHCINEVDNEFATHTCSNKLGKFILVERNGKTEFLICSNCKKVYYETMILCKCYKCNIEYYTEILPNKENEFILPATWDNYHCKQITKEKMKCIKCREIIYINLKTNMLLCLNKNCNFTSKPNKILWTCAICNQDFKSGAIPYNPLEIEIIKKVIKQTLYLKHYAHPNKVPCCKVNIFFSEFHHKKKCDGVLYTGELNNEVIIVCEKCHAINFYERFIWICPKCGNKFKDEGNKENTLSDDLYSDKNSTFKSSGDKKRNEKDLEEDISSNSNNSKNRNNYRDNNNNKDNTIKETKAFDLGKNNNSEKFGGNQSNKDNDNNDEDNEEEPSIKKTKSSRFKRKLKNIYYEREREKKVKDVKVENYRTEIQNDKIENENENNEEKNNIEKQRKRSRFYSAFLDLDKEPKTEEKKNNNNNNTVNNNNNEERRKIEKPSLNFFSKFRKNNKINDEKQITEPKENNKRVIIKVNKREDKNIQEKEKDKDKEKEIKKESQKNSKIIVPYRSFKRNNINKVKKEFDNSKEKNDLSNVKPEASKELNIPERRRFLSNARQLNEKKLLLEQKNNNRKKYSYQKLEEEEEIEEDDLKSKKRTNNNNNKDNDDISKEVKKEENNQSLYNRWKFRRPEAKKTLGKEIKEEISPSRKLRDKNKSNNINSNEENEEKNIYETLDNPKDDNKKAKVKMSKIPGMSENLYNHVNKRISNIISKCTIPLMEIEDYTLTQKIGEGSYGIIFRVISKKDNKEYALKKIISNKLQKISEFIKEFELVYSCHHENIMKIYSYCIRILDSTTYALYVLMEISSGDWDKEIKYRLLQRNNYTEKELINILFQLTSGLLYIQEKFHISHRDIKPQNVLVFPGGKYKMADFGEAKEAKVMRQRNTLRGTELYMSPALYDGLKHERDDVSHNPFKSDVFSLGFCFIYAAALNFNLLYQMRDVLENKNINIILHKYLNKFYSEKFISLLASMLEIDEGKRFDFIDIKTYIENNYGEMIK